MDLIANNLTSRLDLETVVRKLDLRPLEPEGGYFSRTFLSAHEHDFWMGRRSVVSSIYYLVTPESFSSLHRLQSDEIYHFYLGDPLELHEVDSTQGHRIVTLGQDLIRGQRPQAVIRAGSWQASRSLGNTFGYSLVGTTVAPGFDFRDFELMKRTEFSRWPDDLREQLGAFIK
jgi:predicted cupin superfamily sugar epimerase